MLLPWLAMLLLVDPPAPVDPPQLRELAQRVDAEVREHKSAEAVAMLDQGLKASPEWRHGWWLLGSILYDMENYPAARTAMERLLRLDPKPGAPWALLGLCEFEMKDYGLALQHLQRGDAFGVPEKLDLLDVVRYHEALLLMMAERFDTAQAVLDQLTRKGLDTDEIVLAQGMAALRIPLFPASLQYTAGAERIDLVRQVGQAQHLMSRDKLIEAAELYKGLASKNVSLPNLHLSFGALLSQMRMYPEAEYEFRAELKLNPKSVEARLGLCIRLEESLPQQAVSVATEAVRLDPKSFKTHFALGRLLFKTEKFGESVKELEVSRDLDPYSSMVRFALMKAYQAVGRDKDAGRESAAFKRLRSAEDEFRKSGKVPTMYFEPDATAAGASGKSVAAPKSAAK